LSIPFTAGLRFEQRVELTPQVVRAFADFSGDVNPIHLDTTAANTFGYARPIAHGAILVSALSRLIGMEVPGPGAVWMSQSMEWLQPVFVGDSVDLVVTVDSVSHAARLLHLSVVATSLDVQVMKGQAVVKIADKTETAAAAAPTTRVALITGAGRGIGAATARALAAAGWTVAVNYRQSADAAADLVAEIVNSGGTARAFRADISDPAQMASLVRDAESMFGRVDCFVHNATPAIQSVKVESASLDECLPYLVAYSGAALAGVRALVPGMRERGFGRLIFMGSSAMYGIPPAGWAPYVMAKESLWGLVKAMAGELGPSRITANMVSPGLTVTELTDGVPARAKEVEARRSPMRRLATPGDTAALITFLASDAAGFINGAHLPVTGGPQ